ncbi:MAG: 3D domain-containing protein [Deltaproteobacteria bacterium]|nr:3D domain-containing protein [Deltaproteobacteria bacterium]
MRKSSDATRTQTGICLSLIPLLLLLFLQGCCLLPKKEREYQRVTRTMLVTAYDPGAESCGWERKYWCIGPPVYAYGPLEGQRKEVGITADGTKAKHGTIAADIRRYPFGTKMYVPGYGWGEVHDTGSALKGDHIDVFFFDRDDALAWGRKYLKVVILLPR